jgi:hypothetical protein
MRNPKMPHTLSRRELVASAVALPALLHAQEPKPKDDPVAFFLIGDTHFLADYSEKGTTND